MKKQSLLTPIGVGIALLLLLLLIARTDLFRPLVQFIHTGEITAVQALYCFLAAVAAFLLILKLLIMLGGYFLPKTEKKRKEEMESTAQDLGKGDR